YEKTALHFLLSLSLPKRKCIFISPCASCKLLRRHCAKDGIFAPYFPPDDPHKFAIVHKVFGASNVSKMLQVSRSSSHLLYILLM
uniref:LOB domain-containing protein 12-like n=1 Tax=Nicotiana sylvestris TaxID=4096 RepID=A0A1U7V5B2_NICSY